MLALDVKEMCDSDLSRSAPQLIEVRPISKASFSRILHRTGEISGLEKSVLECFSIARFLVDFPPAGVLLVLVR
jgi:hypothetical protein